MKRIICDNCEDCARSDECYEVVKRALHYGATCPSFKEKNKSNEIICPNCGAKVVEE